jgi:hypothetical protein
VTFNAAVLDAHIPDRTESRVGWCIACLASAGILLLPAIWNGFPLLEYDTGGYLARWFEGYLVPSRPAAYGLLLVPAAPFEFWPVLALQGWNRKPLPQGSLPRFPGQAVRFSRPTSRNRGRVSLG